MTGKRNRWLALTAMVLLMAGCAKKPETDAFSGQNNSQEESAFGESEKIKIDGTSVTGQLADNITINAEVSCPEEEAYGVLKSRWKDTMDVGQALDILFSGENYEVTEQEKSYYFNSEIASGIISPSSSNIDYIRKEYTNKGYLTVINNIHLKEAPQYWHQETCDRYADTELEGYSKEEAIRDLGELLKDLGYEMEDEPFSIYGMTGADYKEELTKITEESGGESFISEEYSLEDIGDGDGFYSILWGYSVNEAPLARGNYERGTNHVTASSEDVDCGHVYALMRKDGLLYFSTRNAHQILEQGEPEKMLSLEEILTKIPDYYSNTLLTVPRIVTRVEFCYIPVLTQTGYNEVGEMNYYDMIPGWCIRVERDEGHSAILWEIIYMDGRTGEIIR